MSEDRFDIAIVGSGPAGVSTWLHLHDRDPRLASRCVVLERTTHPREKICGGGLTWTGDRQLEFLDIAVDVPGVPIHEVEFRFGETSIRLPGDDTMRVVRRREFDAELVRIASDRGLPLHDGHAVTAVEAGPDRVIVRTARCDYTVRALVGADGAQSFVRTATGLASGAGISRLIKTVTPHADQDEGSADDTVVFDFGPFGEGLQGYVWHFPCLRGSERAMDRGVFDSRVVPDRPRVDLRSIFSRELEAAGCTVDPVEWRAHPVRPFTPEAPLSAPGVLLVGDAAGIDPILGEGISQSLRYGDVAADTLVDAFERDDFSMESYPAVFADHDLGRSLLGRFELARALYSIDRGATDDFRNTFGRWVAEGLP